VEGEGVLKIVVCDSGLGGWFKGDQATANI